MYKFKAIFTKIWTPMRFHGEGFGFIFLFIGLVTLLIIKLVTDSPAFSDIIGIILGLLSVWLGFTAVGMSVKSDLKYTEIFTRVDSNIIKLGHSYDKTHDKIEQPSGNIIITPQPATLKLTTFPPTIKIEKREKTSKEAAQARLNEDTKKVGFVRGEIYQLEDGSWGIHWGGKYTL